jgi:hypothetical protein
MPFYPVSANSPKLNYEFIIKHLNLDAVQLFNSCSIHTNRYAKYKELRQFLGSPCRWR